MDVSLDMLYRRLWSDWVIRSRVIGWWLYTNTLTGDEFLSWLTSTQICANTEEARHFANQLLLVNFLIRIHPERNKEDVQPEELTDDDSCTIYQINVCCNQSVDTATKVFHTLAHAVRLCSVHSEDCIYYGKSDVKEDVLLEQFELEESSPPPSLESSDNTDTSLSASEEAKRFLQSVCRAYYPKFTSAIEDTYFSYEINSDSCDHEDFSIPDEMFHSYQLSTFDQEDSIVIELEDGVNLQDLDGDGRSILRMVEEDSSLEVKERSSTLDLLPTPRDSSLMFQTARLEINYEDIPSL
ncbi:uncharacterized protein LOC134822239 [Bolinopsis microptera]|uniref:uncharacterized protein LOC134822239 n=1 Tax=Bolinopsis microptera TaxID=2820187 RepID=UPI0030796278